MTTVHTQPLGVKAIERARGALLARREELTVRLEALESVTVHRDEPLPADFSEQATELEDRDVQEALGAESREELRAVNRALHRIEHGDYGSCERCGESIAAERLAVLPFAPYCIRCARETN